MAVKIRLARGGAKKRPFYKIVAADIRAPRDGKFIEKLGTFNPLLPKDNEQRLVIQKDRIEQWIKNGAKPTDRVALLITELGIEVPGFVKKNNDNTKNFKRRVEKEKELAAKKAEEDAAKAEAEAAAKAEEENSEEAAE